MNILWKQNIILTWMPWSWKTTIWKETARQFWYNFIDFDDDILENICFELAEEILSVLNLRNQWFIPEDLSWENIFVKDILSKIWEENFLELEWYLWKKLVFENNTIFSTSWSLPMKIEAMDSLKKSWNVIYIDTKIETILNRLDHMKTDRIIWMWKMTLKEILLYREKFYNISKDFNFQPPEFESVWYKNKYIRNREKNLIFKEFILFLNNIDKLKWN